MLFSHVIRNIPFFSVASRYIGDSLTIKISVEEEEEVIRRHW